MEEIKQSDSKNNQANEDYLRDFQIGQYQNNKQFIESQVFVNAGETEAGERVIFMFGKFFPVNSKKEISAFKRYFIYLMDELVNGKYFIFLFYSDLSSYSYIQCMYTLMRHLPTKYYSNLQKLFIVSPSFLLKTYNLLNTPSKLKSKLYFLDSVKEVYELPLFRPNFKQKILPYARNQEQLTQQQKEREKLFGVSLEDLEKIEGQIPIVISELIKFFDIKEENIKEEGIFRKAPRESDLIEMEQHLIQKDYVFIREHDDPHVVASALKRLLNQLPEPIIPFKQYDVIKKMVGIKSKEEKHKRMREMIKDMPSINFCVLSQIMKLLKKVEQFSHFNLMKVEALTIMFAPTLIRCRAHADKNMEALEQFSMNPIAVEVIQFIYLNQESIFQEGGESISNEDDENESSQEDGEEGKNLKKSEIYKSIIEMMQDGEEQKNENAVEAYNDIDFAKMYNQQIIHDQARSEQISESKEIFQRQTDLKDDFSRQEEQDREKNCFPNEPVGSKSKNL